MITLGIIGIVAAMTLPTLMAKHQDKVLETRAKKTYSVIAQALVHAQNDYGTVGDNASLFSIGKSSSALTREFAKYFVGATYCAPGETSCKNLNYKILYATPLEANGGKNPNLGSMTNVPRILLPDGAVIALTNNNKACEPYIASGVIYNSDGSLKRDPVTGDIEKWTATRRDCGSVIFDTNGPKSPNQFGRDAFSVIVTADALDPGYWSATGTDSLKAILQGKPMKYKKYSATDEFEW